MSWWGARLKEQEKLKQLLNNLVTGAVSAIEYLHQRGLVSLNLQCEYIISNCISLPGSFFSEQHVCEVQL